MRLVILGTVIAAALATVPASAQSQKLMVEGSKAFCLKGTDKFDCSFDTMAACQKGMKDKAKDSTSAGSCVSRTEAR